MRESQTKQNDFMQDDKTTSKFLFCIGKLRSGQFFSKQFLRSYLKNELRVRQRRLRFFYVNYHCKISLPMQGFFCCSTNSVGRKANAMCKQFHKQFLFGPSSKKSFRWTVNCTVHFTVHYPIYIVFSFDLSLQVTMFFYRKITLTDLLHSSISLVFC